MKGLERLFQIGKVSVSHSVLLETYFHTFMFEYNIIAANMAFLFQPQIMYIFLISQQNRVWGYTEVLQMSAHIVFLMRSKKRKYFFQLLPFIWIHDISCYFSFFDINTNMLPEIRSSAEVYGSFVDGPLKNTPISGVG